MSLRAPFLAGLIWLGLGCAGSFAQSLSPMHAQGMTPGDIKGFRLTVANPYHQRMVFDLIPMEPGFIQMAADAAINPTELVLAPGYARQVIFAFRIPAGQKERTIGLCIQPKDLEGPVLPRVCGTYTGARYPSARR